MVAQTSKCAPSKLLVDSMNCSTSSSMLKCHWKLSVRIFSWCINKRWIPQTCLNYSHPGSDEDSLVRNECQASFPDRFEWLRWWSIRERRFPGCCLCTSRSLTRAHSCKGTINLTLIQVLEPESQLDSRGQRWQYSHKIKKISSFLELFFIYGIFK